MRFNIFFVIIDLNYDFDFEFLNYNFSQFNFNYINILKIPFLIKPIIRSFQKHKIMETFIFLIKNLVERKDFLYEFDETEFNKFSLEYLIRKCTSLLLIQSEDILFDHIENLKNINNLFFEDLDKDYDIILLEKIIENKLEFTKEIVNHEIRINLI